MYDDDTTGTPPRVESGEERKKRISNRPTADRRKLQISGVVLTYPRRLGQWACIQTYAACVEMLAGDFAMDPFLWQSSVRRQVLNITVFVPSALPASSGRGEGGVKREVTKTSCFPLDELCEPWEALGVAEKDPLEVWEGGLVSARSSGARIRLNESVSKDADNDQAGMGRWDGCMNGRELGRMATNERDIVPVYGFKRTSESALATQRLDTPGVYDIPSLIADT